MIDVLPEYPKGNPGRTFARLLERHLARGTRHNTTPEKPGRPWKIKEFSDQCGVGERKVRMWKRGARPQHHRYLKIVELLFGKNPADVYAGWFQEFQDAYAALGESDRRTTRFNAPNAFAAYGTGGSPPIEMPEEIWDCYEKLFAIPEERDDKDNIKLWLKQGNSREDDGYEWVECVFSYAVRGRCVGFAFLSSYVPNPDRGKRPSGWWFGNYFGVRDGWRDQGIAAEFLGKIAQFCQQLLPDAKGIIFEVERFRVENIKSAYNRLLKLDPNTKPSDIDALFSADELTDVRAALRIALYTGKSLRRLPLPKSMGSSPPELKVSSYPHALSLVHKSGSSRGYQFVDYIQPALEEPLSSKNEVDLWLMVYPLAGLGIGRLERGKPHPLSCRDARELFDFIYGELFPSAYAREHDSGAALDSSIEGYSEYLKKFEKKIVKRALEHPLFLVDQLMVPKEVLKLLTSLMKQLGKLKINL